MCYGLKMHFAPARSIMPQNELRYYTVGNMTTFWLITNSRFLFKFGLKKVDFSEILAPFLVIFQILAPNFPHIFKFSRPLDAKKFRYLSFITHDNLFLRQIFCEIFMSQKWSIFPTVPYLNYSHDNFA